MRRSLWDVTPDSLTDSHTDPAEVLHGMTHTQNTFLSSGSHFLSDKLRAPSSEPYRFKHKRQTFVSDDEQNFVNWFRYYTHVIVAASLFFWMCANIGRRECWGAHYFYFGDPWWSEDLMWLKSRAFCRLITFTKCVCVCLILLCSASGKAGCLPGGADKDRKESEVHAVCGCGGRTTGSDEEGEGQPRGLDHLHTRQEWELYKHSMTDWTPWNECFPLEII